MKIMYVTANVLGDSGANAAEIFPRLAVGTSTIKRVMVADFARNKDFVRERQFAEFLRLREYNNRFYTALRAAVRIAKVARSQKFDVIHIFYRNASVPMVIFIRLALLLLWHRAIIIMDHRSVNLARGRRAIWKKASNTLMQVFVHRLAGNPWAVETNHFVVFKRKSIIDLGYDRLPAGHAIEPVKSAPTPIWFIGSLRPRNRKSEFLIRVFALIHEKTKGDNSIEIHVAGPARDVQAKAMRKIPSVTFYGRLERPKLYRLLRRKPGIGVAFMNMEFHSFAPSLKFCEYAIMRYKIVASDTLGLRTQAARMNLDGVVFTKETEEEWADRLILEARSWKELEPEWADASLWSYTSIFERQVVGLYEELTGRRA